MTEIPDVGIDVGGRIINLEQLEAELKSAGVSVNGLTWHGPSRPVPPPGTPIDPVLPAGTKLYTHSSDGTAIDLPPEAKPIVDAHIPA